MIEDIRFTDCRSDNRLRKIQTCTTVLYTDGPFKIVTEILSTAIATCLRKRLTDTLVNSQLSIERHDTVRYSGLETHTGILGPRDPRETDRYN